MLGHYTRERIENWVSEFCESDALRDFPESAREAAQPVLTLLLTAACEARGIEPGDMEEQDLRKSLIENVSRLQLPEGARDRVPAICGAFLEQLEYQGRLGDGRRMGNFVRALGKAYSDAAAAAGGKPKPIQSRTSKISRNDPCPCGSGKKYKKCCMGS
ncbi:MAG: hypothetical protein A2Z34_12160 [Planctomycetes bacterium RBG_16_59_8]|nr:MAG: hypothetical protein A2Z34_12160 [Planctomycetes bacterium RBG_16_59_8]